MGLQPLGDPVESGIELHPVLDGSSPVHGTHREVALDVRDLVQDHRVQPDFDTSF